MVPALEECRFATSYHGRKHHVSENDCAQEKEPTSLLQTLSPVLMALIHSQPQSSHDQTPLEELFPRCFMRGFSCQHVIFGDIAKP